MTISSFWGVFWVDVSTTSSAENTFINIASKLNISAQSLKEALQGLANIKHLWLLVLDNADDPDVDYQCYFPAGPSGVVILTSRNTECHQHANTRHLELEGLPKVDARKLLLCAAKVPQEEQHIFQDDAQSIAVLLGLHPLALILAGAYISRGHCTLAGYSRVYYRQRDRLLKFRPAQAQSRYGDVYTTFEASAEALQAQAFQKEAAKDALRLLPVLGICTANRIPLLPLIEAGWKGAQSIKSSNSNNDDSDSLRLTSWHVSQLPVFQEATTDVWDSFRLTEAVWLLKAFSLVSTDTYDGFLSLSMHPLTNAWARDRLDRTAQHNAWLTTGCLVAISGTDQLLWRKHGRQLQPHLEALTLWDISKVSMSQPLTKITAIVTQCGWLLYRMRADTKLLTLVSGLMKHLTLNPLIVNAEWLPVYDLSSRNLVDCGHTRKAISLLGQVVQIREQTLAEDHPDRLASQHELAGAYQANGQVKEAVSLLEQVVQIKEQTLAEDHPSRLASQHELAGAYQANGHVKEAVSLLEQVVQIKEQTLAEDHPSRLASQHELAGAYRANGQVKEAVSLLEQVVQIKEQTLAEDHPSRLASQHALAGTYQANGQVKEAVSLLEQVVQIREQTLAEDHPSRLASQHELAGAYQANGQVKEAVSLLEQVVQIKEQTLAEDHPSRLASQHELAGAYQANKQVKEAVSLLEQVVQIEEQTLAEDHPSRLVSQHELATILWYVDRHHDALQMMKHVVEVQRKVLHGSHPARINAEVWLSYFKGKTNNIEPA